MFYLYWSENCACVTLRMTSIPLKDFCHFNSFLRVPSSKNLKFKPVVSCSVFTNLRIVQTLPFLWPLYHLRGSARLIPSCVFPESKILKFKPVISCSVFTNLRTGRTLPLLWPLYHLRGSPRLIPSYVFLESKILSINPLFLDLSLMTWPLCQRYPCYDLYIALGFLSLYSAFTHIFSPSTLQSHTYNHVTHFTLILSNCSLFILTMKPSLFAPHPLCHPSAAESRRWYDEHRNN